MLTWNKRFIGGLLGHICPGSNVDDYKASADPDQVDIEGTIYMKLLKDFELIGGRTTCAANLREQLWTHASRSSVE